MIGRVFRIVRVPLTLLVLLGILLYGWWWGYQNVIRPVPALPAQPCVQQTAADGQLRSAQVTVTVLNGGNRRGLAGDVARSLRDKGFKVSRFGNADSQTITKTVIVGAAASNPEVKLVQGFFKGAVVKADKRADRSVDVLVGNDYGGFNKDAKTTIAVSTKTVCLPSQATATTGS